MWPYPPTSSMGFNGEGVAPVAMNAPAGMPSSHLERVVSAGLRALLVRRQMIIQLQVPIMVDIELYPPGECRVRLLFLRVPGERHEGFPELQGAGVTEGSYSRP